MTDFDWVLAKVQEKLDWTSQVDPSWTRDWLLWCNMRQFLYVLKGRKGYVIMRPVHSLVGLYMMRDYFGTIMWYHRHGDTAWVDSGWAPGHWPDVVDLFRASKRRYVAWNRFANIYFAPINEISGKTPVLSQLRKYQKRLTKGRIASLGLDPEAAPEAPKMPNESHVNGPEFDHDVGPNVDQENAEPALLQENADP